ncbi:lymphotoxin-alpha isoform X1 [Pygocentrus nattereri]|uniref:lymphotoxin-alpha isoform X1 n=1 Tax=Pygocentrus nattereri TaxID=42514 RepID=UPI000814A005|nr:lymphotoxin-alpha isoform X1 [Pygocentrus nattereri]
MYGQSHIRFNILLGWCCLLSVAVLVMAMVLATGINNKSPSNGMQQGSTETPDPFSYSQVIDLPTGTRSPFAQTSTNHIHLVSGPEQDNETSWQQGQMCFCKNTSLLLKDNRVKITVGGFYYIYAQVSFKQVDKGTVTVIANENIPNKTPRKLIEAQQHSPGTVSMSGVILLKKGDSVKLAIWSLNKSMLLLKDESQTHWGLFLFARQQDY